MDTIIVILQIIILICFPIIFLLLKSYLPKYLGEKGKNLATKEDIEEITRKIESVKAEVSKEQSIHQAKFKLKHEACLEALSLIDAHLSHSLNDPKGHKIVKQYSTTEQARACHNKLILSCENTEILSKFDEIMFGPRENQQPHKPPTDLLNEFRNMIRRELGFGSELQLDRDRAWFGKVNFEQEQA